MTRFRRLSALSLSVFLLVPLTSAVPAAAADAPAYERLLNGDFDSGVKTPWWTSGNTPPTVADGRLCAQIPGGTVNVWDSMIGQDDMPVEAGQPYTLRFDASATRAATFRAVAQTASKPVATVMNKTVNVTTTPQTFTFTANSPATAEHLQVSFQAGGSAEPYTLCLDNISLVGGVVPPGGVRDLGSPVRVNQLGYLENGPKRATYVTDLTRPQSWRLLDAASGVVAHGKTKPHGADAMSGTNVQLIDFDRYRGAGEGYRLAVGDQLSEPFTISDDLYSSLRQDALAYFYNNRSGIPIEAQYVGAERARLAGHVGIAPNKGDVSVPCFPGTCTYSLDVQGGWYDAGDHGKYVVNGALAAWQLLDQYEQSGDQPLRIPEAGNKIPDLLDEAKWQVDFLLRMQGPSGMVHHKIHDVKWTGLPLKPAADPQQRYLYPPSTAATLNVAAVGARCARVYARWDKAFAAQCLAAADKAWKAALQNPAIYAPDGGEGGGAYDDVKVTDEFSWAAAELFATTGKQSFKRAITTQLKAADGFSWQETGGLADLALARATSRLSLLERLKLTLRISKVADEYVADLRSQGYANPYLPSDGKYVWGSNSAVANNSMIMATAYDLTHLGKYREAALESLDYLLGRNALNQSYVTGYGERASHNQHHRFWAKALDPALPAPAPGSLAGGPNSGLQDPVALRGLQGCAPATCYLDHTGSYSTNEVAVNWNSALAWITAFADTSTRRSWPHAAAAAGAGAAPAKVLASPVDLTSGLYVNPTSTPKTWVNNNGSDSRAATINSNIASKPTAKWFGNPPSGTTIGAMVGAYVGAADSADKLPILVAYNLPGRDACGGHSGGGAGSPAAYRTWISAFADSIGTRPAVVVLEPDALGDFECMTAAQISERNGMLAFATQQFKDRAPNTWAYLDAGNAGWVPAATMAQRLQGAGIADARGFAVNVSNYYTTSASITYANNVRTGLGTAKPFVIDTSRNGNGSSGVWCNPAGRKLGSSPQIGGGAELLLWIKVPGNSDGACGTAPTVPAGTFSPDLATRLISGT
ncbi:glycoside hydrolase family 9 protein [Kribbella sp. CA-293567]|uniref:glycoside hydrolase family 9 protein n=1 Tax=Kribbella sp. CA-293567 TaxID=3002436 RepID=UPI0022DE65C2|nr:glycoside hydrolase family 9 protein [Kribbella sp. CA-293567]WBQ02891.1 glycoside hydrolase family 9 protein [Kribbella sp. CA-293567]